MIFCGGSDTRFLVQLCGLPGGFLGLFLCGWAQERYGSRKTYLAGMLLSICCTFLYVFAQSLGMLLGAQAIAACSWGIFSELDEDSRQRSQHADRIV